MNKTEENDLVLYWEFGVSAFLGIRTLLLIIAYFDRDLKCYIFWFDQTYFAM